MALAINIVLGADTATFSRKVSKATNDASRDFDKLKKSADTAIDGDKIAKQINRVQAAVGGIGDKLKSLAGIGLGGVLAGFSVGGLIDIADQMQGIDSKIRLATKSGEQFHAVQQQLRDIALQQKTGYQGLVDLYSSSQRALAFLGKTQQQTIDFTKNLSQAMAIGGGSAESQAAALTQLGQALGSGALKGDEFNSIAEQAPILLDLFSKELGVTATQIKKLGSDGKITSEVIYNAVTKATDQLSAMAAKMPTTFDQGITVLRDRFNQIVGDFVNGQLGLGAAIGEAMAGVAGQLNNIITVASAVAVVMATQFVHGFITAKLGVDSLTGSLIAKTTATLSSIKATAAESYSMQTQIAMINAYHRNMMLINLTKTQYINILKSAWTSTTGYVNTLRTAITTKGAFTAQVRAATASMMAYTRSVLSANTAKRAMIGTTALAGRGVGVLAGGLRALAGIIRAHPLMIAAGVIAGIAVKTMGAKGAMDSFSHAIRVCGAIMSDVTDGIVSGIMWVIKQADKLFNFFSTGSAASSKNASTAFGGFFSGTQGGFVGLIQIIARIFDNFSAIVRGTLTTAYNNIRAFCQRVAQVFTSAFNGIANLINKAISGAVGAVNSVIRGISAVSGAVNEAAGANVLPTLTEIKNIPQIQNLAPVVVDARDLGLMSNINKAYTGSAERYVTGVAKATKNGSSLFGGADLDSAMGKLAGSADDAAKAAKGKAGADKDGAKGAKGRAKADKEAKDATDKLKEAQQKLAEAFNEKQLDYQKKLYDLGKPLQLEIDALEWELKNGELAKLSENAKHQLRVLAIQVDQTAILADIQKMNNDTVRESTERAGLRLEKLLGDFNDPFNKLSAFVDQEYQIAFENGTLSELRSEVGNAIKIAANADISDYQAQVNQVVSDLADQNELLKHAEGISREMAKIEQERVKSLAKFSFMQEKGLHDEYKLAELEARREADAKKRLLAQERFVELTKSVLTDEQQKLDVMRDQLSVLAQQRLLNPKDAQGITSLDILDNALGLPKPELSELEKLEQQQQQRYQILQAWRDKELELYQGNQDQILLTEATFAQKSLELAEMHKKAKIELELSTGEQMVGVVAEGAKAMFGEQSKAYRVLFAMEKGFAIAKAAMALHSNVAEAMKIGFPQNIPMIAAATAQGIKIVQAIRSIAMPVGQAHDGIMSVPKSGTWNLEKGERVLPKHTAKALDAKLDSMGNGGNNINVSVTVNSDGGDVQANHDMGKRFGEAIKSAVQTELMKERRQGGLLYAR